MLTAGQLNDFNRNGALVVPGVVDAETLAAVRREYAARTDDIIARCVRLGMMRAPAARAGFGEKITALLRAAPQCYQHLDISLPMLGDLAAEAREWQKLFGDDWEREAGFFGGDSVFNLITHPRITAIARQILGGSVILSPVQHVRIKPPQRFLPPAAAGDANMARTLWHQDEAVVTEEAKDVPILTVWLAVSDATVENGCMFAEKGGHRRRESRESAADFGLVRHCPGRELAGEIYIPDAAIRKEDLMPLEAKAGDAVLLHRRTVHGAGANNSAGIRWSFDLRYQPAGTPSGRDCFPSFAVSGDSPVASGEAYRRQWRRARDGIISGKIKAVFNKRWNKYAGAGLCA